MDQTLIAQLDQKIDELRAELAVLTIRLVNIKSVQGAPLADAPFGIGPKRVLDEVLQIGKEYGFSTADYGVGVVSLALEQGQPDLGIWVHGDVVPEGDGWNFEPYNAVEHQGCVIGRGSADNKGQLAAIFLLLRTFKELQIPLTYNPALYVGSNEETGMADVVEFLKTATPPTLSLVPDGGFPVGYGGKGTVNLKLRSRTPLHGCTLTAGQDASPGLATAIFDSTTLPDTLPACTINGNTVTAWTAPRHGANPDPNGNMITVLSEALLNSKTAHTEDRYIWEFLRTVSSDIHGELLEIQTTSDHMSPLTVFAKQINNVDGYPELTLNIRYPVGITYEEIVQRATAAAEQHGFTVTYSKAGTPAYLLDPEAPMVHLLCDAANSVIGTDAAPFTMSGGTYAHRLPNAYVFGSSSNLPPADFPEGRGGAHGMDEAVSLDRLQRAMRIYARALLALNETEW